MAVHVPVDGQPEVRVSDDEDQRRLLAMIQGLRTADGLREMEKPVRSVLQVLDQLIGGPPQHRHLVQHEIREIAVVGLGMRERQVIRAARSIDGP